MRTLTTSCRHYWALAVLPAATFAFAASALAGDSVFYAGGKAYAVVRSTTEFGVKLQDKDLGPAVANELDATGIGHLDELDGAQSPYRLLRVGAANVQTRNVARAVNGVEWVRPVYRVAGQQSPLLCTGELVVRVAPNVTDAQARDMFSGFGLTVLRAFDGLDNTYVLRPDDDVDGDAVAVAAELYGDGRVVYSHPNFVVHAAPRQVTVADEYFGQQWHLNNTGQGGGTADADIDVLDAWTITQGEDVRVGMLDDCCDTDHEDLRSNYLNIGQDINDGDDDPRPAQIGERHGTCVMGLICAAGNDAGVRGVAPNARFTATRGLGFTTIAEQASAYTFARQQDVGVHNNSWGYIGLPAPDVVADAIRTAFEDGREGKGMVILFASGNDGREAGDDIAALATVIAVGATNASDVRSSYSNYGAHLEVVAPSNFGEEAVTLLPSLVTTDNTDDAGYAEPGYNFGGFDDYGFPDLANPDYTQTFGGTSGACPITAGVAALILSANDQLTATQVRVILEHTAEKVSPADAEYDGVTSHSLKYGYGRINAAAAAQIALESVDNGNLTWPDRVSNVRVSGTTLHWSSGSETQGILIVSSANVFQWVPVDGTSYSDGQEVATGVTVVFKDATGEAGSFEFADPGFGTTYFGIYTYNALARYSWGVLVDSAGNVTGAGPVDTGDSGTGESPDDVLPIYEEPKVSVEVSPRSGESPLTVTFQGNALTDSAIASNTWDFGDGSPTESERDATHTYTVTADTTFIATFTVVDEDGDVGSRSVAIEVTSGQVPVDDDSGAVRIQVTDAAGQPIESGFAPLEVRLTVETEDLPGVFNSIRWDLGDGTTADTLTVLHTYDRPGTWWISAQVTTCDATNGCRTTSNPNGVTWQQTSQPEFITVLASNFDGSEVQPDVADETGTISLSTGHTASPVACGIGLLPLWLGMLGLAAVRRRLG